MNLEFININLNKRKRDKKIRNKDFKEENQKLKKVFKSLRKGENKDNNENFRKQKNFYKLKIEKDCMKSGLKSGKLFNNKNKFKNYN